MNIPTSQAIFSFLNWRATEEEYDAEFFEGCARRFEVDREPLLQNAKICRERATNIRAASAFLRGDRIE
jgi:hypothetical protein